MVSEDILTVAKAEPYLHPVVEGYKAGYFDERQFYQECIKYLVFMLQNERNMHKNTFIQVNDLLRFLQLSNDYSYTMNRLKGEE